MHVNWRIHFHSGADGPACFEATEPNDAMVRNPVVENHLAVLVSILWKALLWDRWLAKPQEVAGWRTREKLAELVYHARESLIEVETISSYLAKLKAELDRGSSNGRAPPLFETEAGSSRASPGPGSPASPGRRASPRPG